MRIGGLATGMDIEEMVDQLMEAERIPLTRMQQDQTKLEWKRDAFRDINRTLLKLDDLTLDMKLSQTYQAKQVSSSQEHAVTASASSSSSPGSYAINVEQLASQAMIYGDEGSVRQDELDQPIEELEHGEQLIGETITFTTFLEDGSENVNEVKIEEGDSIQDILVKINQEDSNIRSFYDANKERIVFETSYTGIRNEDGFEIAFGDDKASRTFFKNILTIDPNNDDRKKDANNARFTYNDSLQIESTTNSYEMNGIEFEFKDTTDGNAAITVTNDTEQAFEKIMEFVDQYNEVVEALNKSQREQRHRDFPPLTDEQKEEMTEKQIEMWEEKAKSGILRGETVISNGLYAMRQAWYSTVDTGGKFDSLTQIGIETSENYLDGGKLIVDEGKLRQALNEDIDSVQKLFTNRNEAGENRGIIHRLEDTISSTMKSIERQAGNEYQTLDNYALGRRMKDLNDRIVSFEERMERVETRYWKQFTEMEKAIQQLNEQAEYMFSQFGGQM